MAPLSQPCHGPSIPWSDGLPLELLGIILIHLHCLADRVNFAAVCKVWRAAAQGLGALDAPPRTIPWLLLPSRDMSSFFSLHSGATRRLYLPEEDHGARLCGSYEHGWLVAGVDPWRGYAAINLFTRERVPLPERLKVTHNYGYGAFTSEHHMVIRTVTFSDAPDAENCLAAAHISSASNIAFCRPRIDGYWLAHHEDVGKIEDIMYFRNEVWPGFHVLTNTENVLVYMANGDQDAPFAVTQNSYNIQQRVDFGLDGRNQPNGFSVSRYLVESRGNLLMVLRKYSTGCEVAWRTLMCRIFEMKRALCPHGHYTFSWVELNELRGRVLFLGRGCSRALEVSQFNGLQEGIIYYLDDTSFDLSVVLNNASNYSSNDMGIYAMHNSSGRAQRLPSEFTLDCSPPIWIIH